MIRRLFTSVSAVSLLLCAVSAVFWVRSYYTKETLMRRTWDSTSAV